MQSVNVQNCKPHSFIEVFAAVFSVVLILLPTASRGDSWTSSSGQIVTDQASTKVGIGTSTPAALLDVNGQSIVRGPASFGGAISTDVALLVHQSSGLVGSNQYGFFSNSRFSSAATNLGNAGTFGVVLENANFTQNLSRGIYIMNPEKMGGTATINTNVGLDISPQTAGSTNYAIRTNGTAQSLFGGPVTVSGKLVSNSGLDVNGNLAVTGTLVGPTRLAVNSTGFASPTSFLEAWGTGNDQFIIRNTTAGVNQSIGMSSAGHISINYDLGAALTVNRISGNVGIGTTSPSTKLHVEGQDAEMRIRDPRASGGNSAIGLQTEGQLTRLKFYYNDRFAIDNAGGTEYLSILRNGNVGIGQINPSAKLDVNGSAQISGTLIVNGNTTFTRPLEISGANGEGLTLNRSTGAGYIRWQNGVGGAAWAMQRHGGNGNMVLWSNEGAGSSGIFKIAPTVSGIPIFTADIPNGTVGVGTASPEVQMDINGSIQIDSHRSGTRYGGFRMVEETDGDYNVRFQMGRGGEMGGFRFYSNYRPISGGNWGDGAKNHLMTILGNGKVGVGISDPVAKLDVWTTSDNWSGGWGKTMRLTATQYPTLRFFATQGNKTSMIANANNGGLHFGVGGAGDTYGMTAMNINANGKVAVGHGDASASAMVSVKTSEMWANGWENNLELIGSTRPTLRFNSQVEGTTSWISGGSDGNLYFGVGQGTSPGTVPMFLTQAGNVYVDKQLQIGITTPSTIPGIKLDVEGNARVSGDLHVASVKTMSWGIRVEPPDYVFEKGYKLASLENVEKFLIKNKHLPEVPSAKQFKKDGLDLAEMNMTLLKKVEELTLYAISQNKRATAQERRAMVQEKRAIAQEKEIANLKKSIESLANNGTF